MKAVTGTDGRIPDSIKKQRRESLISWYRGNKNDGGFSDTDIPLIAQKFLSKWSCNISDPKHSSTGQMDRNSFKANDLQHIETEIKGILIALNKRSSNQHSDDQTTQKKTDSDDGGGKLSNEVAGLESSISVSTQVERKPPAYRRSLSTGSYYPTALTKKELSCKGTNGGLDRKKLSEFALIEFLFILHHDKEITTICLEKSMKKNRVPMPHHITVHDLDRMST